MPPVFHVGFIVVVSIYISGFFISDIVQLKTILCYSVGIYNALVNAISIVGIILMINGLNTKAYLIRMYLYCVRRRAMMAACSMEKQDFGRLSVDALISIVK